MTFLQDAKAAITLLRNDRRRDAENLIRHGREKYSSRFFFHDLHGMNLPVSASQEIELTEQMSAGRRALCLSYYNALAIRSARMTSDESLRAGARQAAQDWHNIIVDTTRRLHPTTILVQGIIFYQDLKITDAIRTFLKLSRNSRYWPIALRHICCCIPGDDAPPPPELHHYYDELLAGDLELLSKVGDGHFRRRVRLAFHRP